jgi:hypothetical protein
MCSAAILNLEYAGVRQIVSKIKYLCILNPNVQK